MVSNDAGCKASCDHGVTKWTMRHSLWPRITQHDVYRSSRVIAPASAVMGRTSSCRIGFRAEIVDGSLKGC